MRHFLLSLAALAFSASIAGAQQWVQNPVLGQDLGTNFRGQRSNIYDFQLPASGRDLDRAALLAQQVESRRQRVIRPRSGWAHGSER